ncbi:hypothetical protein JSO19_10115 [Leucobacter sp. UCMA 4100]|uniref:hypothetical protein n=1 Tax=Leucobacter sp. UCMA 4100 TaxID=2810534 RepID=UPI0022EAAB06|nr:hypothetical protein [Leucobacter sp. UCMA 4100]MDA3147732.1 hypothetical protein [Leucobacter sp. UCMA 4100]
MTAASLGFVDHGAIAVFSARVLKAIDHGLKTVRNRWSPCWQTHPGGVTGGPFMAELMKLAQEDWCLFVV